MAWPGNHYSSFWENMYGPNNNQPHGTHGAGVDHAPPPPPPELPQFMNPDFWNRWSQRRGWEDFMGPAEGHSGHGPHGRHAHAHAHAQGQRHPHSRRGGRRDGRGGSGEDEPAEHQGGLAAENEDVEAFPPEYITDDEVAAATAAAEVQEKKADKDRSGSPDTMMRDDAEDPPEEVPNPDESPRHRGFGRHGHRGRGGFGRGGFGREGFGHEGFGHHRRGGRHGARHHGGGSGSFGGMFGGGSCRRRSHGPHGRGDGGHPRGPPFPFPPPFLEAFFGPPRGGPHHGPGAHTRGPPPPLGAGPFDFRGMMGALSSHPYAQQMREYWERNNNRGATPDSSDNEEEENELGGDNTTPPLDLFELADRWVLHLAVPGARKEDVGVDWDADRSVLRVAGVVHRPGDEAFLQGLVSGERRVGMFSREVRLPPLAADPEEEEGKAREEVNGESITAKMEDGVLIVMVPKVKRDWTEVKRVEIY